MSNGTTAATAARLDFMLTRFDNVFPTALFAALFGMKEWQVRKRRRELDRFDVAVRLDRFARTTALPSLKGLTGAERAAVTEYWSQQRTGYARTERVRRMRELVQSCSDLLPAAVIGKLFDVSGGAARQHQVDLGVQRTKTRADELLRLFLRAPRPPVVEALTATEQHQLAQIWREMRDGAGLTQRSREDELLRGLSDRLPTVYFAEKFGIKTESVCARRRELEIECSKESSERLLRAFLRWKAIPELPYLDAAETAELRTIWKRVVARYREKKQRRRQEREQALIRALQTAKKRYRGLLKPVKCGNPKCKFRWHRTAVFFDRNRRQPDGLEPRCKVCEARRRATPKVRTRAKPRILRGAERDRAREIVKVNVNCIPARLLQQLLAINRNHLMYLREEAEVEISTPDSRLLYYRWMIADEMPLAEGLKDDETTALRAIWERERAEYLRSREQDDGKLALQHEERRALVARGTTLPLVTCGGPYCVGEGLTWHRSSQFFRRYGRCKPEERRCHACANREKRERVVQERRENEGKVK